jgi:hypothetical protein
VALDGTVCARDGTSIAIESDEREIELDAHLTLLRSAILEPWQFLELWRSERGL